LSASVDPASDANATMIARMSEKISSLNEMVGALIRDKNPASYGAEVPQPTERELKSLVGHWYNTESASHIYSRIVRGELVSPYCFRGNGKLTGVYFGWRRIGDYWFARYQWINSDISGFSFLKMESSEALTGAWWDAEDESEELNRPPKHNGVPANWTRQDDIPAPSWAEDFFQEVEEEGLASLLAKYR
jgi:hypothetical protein